MSEQVPSQPVANLSQRRMQKLEQENRELKAYVAEVMQRLHENERLFTKLFELESKILKTVDTESFCFTLLRELRSMFHLDMVRLWLDRSSFMGQCTLPGMSEHDVAWLEAGDIARMGLTRRPVWQVRLQSLDDFPWLTQDDAVLSSIALLVLGQDEQAFAVLGLGAKDAERFSPDKGSDFLQHLGQVIGITLENSFVRERVAQLSVRDRITGEYNQRFFQPHSHQAVSRWFGKEIGVACLYMMLPSAWDGAGVTSRQWQAISDLVRATVRVQDLLIRMEDDDALLLFLPSCSIAKAGELAQRMLRDVADDTVCLSIGAAHAAVDEQKQVKALVQEAKQAACVAQALGGQRVEYAGDAIPSE